MNLGWWTYSFTRHEAGTLAPVLQSVYTEKN